ncbi:MAG: type II toxin-antitoxin system RelE/ParE family toxin [Edaphobacter sp.]
MKPIEFCGDSLRALRTFPQPVRREAGFQLDLIQRGFDPEDWKVMRAIGQGVREIRIRDEHGAFRVIYVTKFEDAIYVLHCFQKKTQKTSSADIELATRRYKELRKDKANEQ